MVRCTNPAAFLRLVALGSAVAVIYSESDQHAHHPLGLSTSQQLPFTKASSLDGEGLRREGAAEKIVVGGGGGKKTSLLAVVEGAGGGKDNASLPTARKAMDGVHGSHGTGETNGPQLAQGVRRSRRTAESTTPAPTFTSAATGPMSGLPPTTHATKITNPLAPAVAVKETLAPISTAATPMEATPSPVKETPDPTAGLATPPPTTNPTPVRVSPAPTASPATPQPTTAEPTPAPEPVAPTALPASPVAATPDPAITPTSTRETPSPTPSAEKPTTPPPAVEPTAAADDADPGPAPQPSEEGASPTPPGSTPTPTGPPLMISDPGAVGAHNIDAGSSGSDSGGNDDGGGGGDTGDAIFEPEVDDQLANGGGSGDGFVVGTGLDSDEKQKIVIGASVIGAVAVVLIAAAFAAKRYNARIGELDEDDDPEGGLAKGRPGRLQARQPLPRLNPGPRTVEM
eukprot:g10134.t1